VHTPPPTCPALHDALPICALLAQGIDPQQQKIDDEQAQTMLSNNTFAAVAAEYMSRKRNVSAATIVNNNRQLARLNKHIGDMPRSEEHTSELQSRFDLVCR